MNFEVTSMTYNSKAAGIEYQYEERIRELATLNEIGHALSSSIITRDLINLIYEQTTRIMPVSAFYIALCDKDKKELHFIFDVLENKRQYEEEITRKFGNGRTEYIINTKKPLLVKSDPNKTYRKLGIVSKDKKAKACVGVPLITSGTVLGALVVQSYHEDHGYGDRHIDLLTTIANQAAIALQNANLFEEQKKQNIALAKSQKDTKERVRELAILNEIGHAINSSIVIKDLIKLIYEQTTRILTASAFYIALCDKNKKELHFIFDVLENKRQREEEVTRKFGNGRTEYIINTKKPLLIKGNPQKKYKELGIVSNDKKAKACIGVPLITGGEVLGALVVQSYQNDHGYGKRHIELLTTIANQAAIALQNAKLFEQQKKQNTALAKAQKDTDVILNNVKEGIFLIDQKFRIAAQYSANLGKILEEKNLALKDMLTLLKDKVEAKTLSALSEYLDLLFDQNIDEKMLLELNPLEQIKCVFNENKQNTEKYLTFIFKRVYQDDKIIHIFITVQDITSQIELESALKESQAESKKQMEWLFIILNNNSELLIEFLAGAKEEMKTVKKAVLQKSFDIDDIKNIYRSVHTVKGNAGMLQLQFIQEEAHHFEDFLAVLYQKDIAKINKSELIEKYKKLNNIFNQVEVLINRVNNFNKSFDRSTEKSDNTLFNVLETLLHDLSVKYNKEVTLNHQAYNSSKTPIKYKFLIRDILVQLTRNSFYHGIEPVEKRTPQKPAQGTISLSNEKNDKFFTLIFEDDGGGLPIDKLKHKAIDSGNWTVDEIENWKPQDLIDLIYYPGLSTADKSDLTAGRGIGMDIIKHNVEKHGGSINVTFQKGKFTRFSILLPK